MQDQEDPVEEVQQVAHIEHLQTNVIQQVADKEHLYAGKVHESPAIDNPRMISISSEICKQKLLSNKIKITSLDKLLKE